MTRWACHYHLVWSTKERIPVLVGDHADHFRAIVANQANEQGLDLHAVGTMPDHVHVAISIPPRLSVSSIVGRMKGTSSSAIHEVIRDDWPGWQREYGVFTFSDRSMAGVVDYVTHQRERHAEKRTFLLYESFDSRD